MKLLECYWQNVEPPIAILQPSKQVGHYQTFGVIAKDDTVCLALEPLAISI